MGATFQTVDIPEDMKDQAQEYHEKMMETVVEMDDDILEAYLEVGTSRDSGSNYIKWLLQCCMWTCAGTGLLRRSACSALPDILAADAVSEGVWRSLASRLEQAP